MIVVGDVDRVHRVQKCLSFSSPRSASNRIGVGFNFKNMNRYFVHSVSAISVMHTNMCALLRVDLLLFVMLYLVVTLIILHVLV